MKPNHSWLKQATLAIALVLGSTSVMALPEFPFCPLGGPTGWFNRLTDDDDDRYYPPPYYPPPLVAPYWNQAYPYTYVPRYPVYPGWYR